MLFINSKCEIEIPRTKLLESRVLNKELEGDKISLFHNGNLDAVGAFNSLLAVAPTLAFELRDLQFAPLRQDIGCNIDIGDAAVENNPASHLQPLPVPELPEPRETLRKTVSSGATQ